MTRRFSTLHLLRGAIAALLVTLAAPAAAGATTAWGPLPVGDLFPARRGFLQLGPEAVGSIATGGWRFGVLVSAANTLARDTGVEVALEARAEREPVTVDFLRQLDQGGGSFFIDGEDHSLRLKVEHGLANGWQIAAELPLLAAGAGRLDGVAEGFHSLLGVDQDGRFGLDRNQHLVFLSGGGREFVAEASPGSGIGDLALRAKRHLEPYGLWQRGFEAAIKLPTGDRKRLLSSGSADVALRVLASRPFGRWHLHGGAGMAHLGHWKALGLPPQIQLSGFAAVERVRSSGGSTVLQLVALESPLQELGIPELDQASFQLTLGGYLPLTARHYLTMAVTENVLHFDSGSDFAFHVGVSTTVF